MRHANDLFTLDLPGLDSGTEAGYDPLGWLSALGYSNQRLCGDAGVCATESTIFTGALVVGIDSEGYVGRYCYESDAEALAALVQWDGHGDPPGNWIAFKGRDGDRLGPGSVIPVVGQAEVAKGSKPSWKRIECPACGSPPGVPCFRPRLGEAAQRTRCAPHKARRDAGASN